METDTAQSILMKRQLLEIVVEACGLENCTLSMNTTWEELGMDSLDFMEMIQSAREVVSITDAQVRNLLTIGDLLELAC